MSDLIRFYFSFDGRASRRDFNVKFGVAAILVSVIAACLDFFIINGSTVTMDFKEPFSDFFNVLIFVSLFAIISRRLHDMGHSGWWQLPITVGVGVPGKILFDKMGVTIVDPTAVDVGSLAALVAVIFCYLGFLIFISVKKGVVGPNAYGNDPLEVQDVSQ